MRETVTLRDKEGGGGGGGGRERSGEDRKKRNCWEFVLETVLVISTPV